MSLNKWINEGLRYFVGLFDGELLSPQWVRVLPNLSAEACLDDMSLPPFAHLLGLMSARVEDFGGIGGAWETRKLVLVARRAPGVNVLHPVERCFPVFIYPDFGDKTNECQLVSEPGSSQIFLHSEECEKRPETRHLRSSIRARETAGQSAE